MKINKNTKKRILAFATAITLLFCVHAFKNKKKQSGNIYIGTKEYLDTLNDINDDGILILDERDGSNPNIKIYNSYKITSPKRMSEVIDVILDYEKKDPSQWNRTKKTLIWEWIAHNILRNLEYQTHRTTDVDFDNKDENTYSLRLIKK